MTTMTKPDGVLKIMDSSGDKRVVWMKDAPPQVDEAQKKFDEYIKKGYMAYKVGKKGKKGTQIKEFNASLEEIIMVAPVIGG